VSFPWSDLLHQQLQWEKATGAHDDYGQPSFYPSQTIRCRISYKTHVVRDTVGEDKIGTTVIYVEGNPGISPLDRITLPDGTTPPILIAKTFTDDVGATHQEIVT